MARTVSQVAGIAGISVRTLHHHDEIGLLKPSGRSAAGYRLYSDSDMARLQQILCFRALELPLDDIHRILTNPAYDAGAALCSVNCSERAVQLRALLDAVEAAITRLGNEEPVGDEARLAEYVAEAFAANAQR